MVEWKYLALRGRAAWFGLIWALSCTTTAAWAQTRSAPAQPSASAASLAEQIDALIGQPRFAGADWGISVISLSTGRTVYSHNANQLMQPASTAKLFTAAVTLSQF